MGEWGLLLAFVLCCIVPFVLVVAGLGWVYRQAVTALFCAIHAESLQALPADRLRAKESPCEEGDAKIFWHAHVFLECRYRSGHAAGSRSDIPGYEGRKNYWLMRRCQESICHCSLWQRQSLFSVSASAPLPRLRLAWKENTSGSCGNLQ